MQTKTIIITAILIASSMAISGCLGDDSNDSCQIVDEGEYRSVDSSGEVLGYFRVVGSSQAESPPYSAVDEGSCLLEVDFMLPKIVSGEATGFYLFVGSYSENANDPYTLPLMVSGDKDNPVIVDYDCSGCGSENEVRNYRNDTGLLLDSGNVDWTVGSEETEYGIWEICEGCFETEITGYVGRGAGGWSVYTENDDTISYDDSDGDGVNDMDEVAGCTDATANNHASTATDDDGSCDFDLDDDGVLDANEVAGCTDATANNHASTATDDDGSCDFDLDDDGVLDANEVVGCTNATASNYDSSATDEDGSCEFLTAEAFYLQVLSLFVNETGAPDTGLVPIENLHAVLDLLQPGDVFYTLEANISVEDFVNYSTCSSPDSFDGAPVFCPWGEYMGDYSIEDLERDYGDNLTCLSKEEVGMIPDEGAEILSLLESIDMGAYTYGDSEFFCLMSHPDTWDVDDESGPNWFWDDIALMMVSDAFGHWEIVWWGE